MTEVDQDKNSIPQPEHPYVPKEEVLDRLFQHRNINAEILDTGFRRSSKGKKSYSLILWSISAATIDGLIVFCLSCLAVLSVGLLLQLKISLSTDLLNIFLPVTFLISFVYMLSLRLVLGFTVGEWACDIRLGTPAQKSVSLFPIQVFLRVLITHCSLFLLFPMLSLICGSDLLGSWLNVKLTKLKG